MFQFLRTVTTILSNFLFFSSYIHADTDPCEAILLGAPADTLSPIRREIIAASEDYRSAHPERSFSLFRGNEWREIMLVAGSRNDSRAHAIYLGSGVDIYRLIVDFPQSGNYHFFDHWKGLRLSKGEAFQEIETRIRSFAKNVEIVPVDDRLTTIRFELGDGENKLLWLHTRDVWNSADFSDVLGMIPNGDRLVGVLQAGLSGSPYPSDIVRLLRRLSPDGVYVHEFGGTTWQEWMSDPIQASIFFAEDFERNLGAMPITLSVTPEYPLPTANGVTPRAVAVLIRPQVR